VNDEPAHHVFEEDEDGVRGEERLGTAMRLLAESSRLRSSH
jgi:hypothetical protein